MVVGSITMTSEKTDEQLLNELVAGKRRALAELAGRYERPLLGLAAGLLAGRRDLACDAVQETWVRVIRFAKQFAGRSSFKTWLYRIAVNQCRTLRGGGVVGEPVGAVAATPARDQRPEQAAQTADQNHALQRAVERLEADKQFVVLLCYHGGMTHEQAAEILEIPLGTLKSRLHAALTELRACLGAEGKS
jgi:RNA polymerase sigma factor (sigma-70 family)